MVLLLAVALLLVAPETEGIATYYHPDLHGNRMGCAPYAPYNRYDPTVAAVAPSRYVEWPCGTQLRVTGPAGSIVVTRQDSCPRCGHDHVDISEQGSIEVCGGRPHTCRVTIERVSSE